MHRDPPSAPARPDDPPPRPATAAPLTPTQRAFARLLGRILAERWDREHPPPARPATRPPA